MPTILDTVASALLTYTLHSAAACLVALCVARLMRRPHDRELLWKAALLAPLVSAAVVTALAAFGRRVPYVDLGRLTRIASRVPLPGREVTVRVFETPQGRDVVRHVVDPVATTLSATAVVAALCCVAVALIRLAHRRRALHHALEPRTRVGVLARAVHGRGVGLSTSGTLHTPVAFGRANICLPTTVMDAFDGTHRDALLAHEVAHLQRRDPVWFGAVELIAALSAYQPLVGAVARAFRRDVELICDEAAVDQTGNRAALIGALARLAEPFDARAPICGAATAYDGSPLIARAERIATLTPGTARPRRRHAAAIGIAAVLAASCALPVISAAAPASDFPLDESAAIRQVRARGGLLVRDTAVAMYRRRTLVLLK